MPSYHLIFARHGVHYAVDGAAVQQIAWRPGLCAVAEASPWVIGAFNDHGRVVPVLDLLLCFGCASPAARLSDAIIVLDGDGERFAIVADQLVDGAEIEPKDVEALDRHRELLGSAAPLVSGIAGRGEQLVMVLDVRALLAGAAAAVPEEEGVEEAWSGGAPADAQTDTFRARARALAQPLESARKGEREQFAVITVEAETIGLSVQAVREFMRLGSVWPVPCCPPHVFGNINVRGEILTLVDLRPVLGLPAQRPLSEAAVVRSGELVVGLGVGEVVDIVEVDGVAPLPLPPEERRMPFCRGTARSGERAFTVIDIEAMLSSRLLHVADERGRGKILPGDRALAAGG